ncbi:RNA polymerase sigma factor [Tenacibaculum sp. IB213877]|uniref:RNA polymerase sigma factor n=1 Tax=Tenacibaculum sp. IB213877 TaxID=3097351 RepID=UPI002A5A8C3E|nr:RNA polymerase sigma factor [Tenacibaculum sp. IB213877]MDY0780453.1 RNA polymerase sigma factor [Tenacibaculum sp. IB213877]
MNFFKINLLELIQKCKQNNLQAQAQVYQLFAGKLFALSLKYSRNREDAEDVLQDSFLTAFNKIHQFKNKGSFEGWLKRIAVNTALQKYREKSPLYLVKEEQDIVEEEEVVVDDAKVDISFLLQLIQELPDRYRLVFNLYVLDNFSHKEIAEMLDISEGTSKSNLSRARLILKQKVEKHQQKEENA